MPTFDDRSRQDALAELRQKEEEDLAQELASQYGVPYVMLAGASIDPDALRIIPEEEAREKELAAFEKVGSRIHLAARSPERASTREVIDRLDKEGYKVVPYITSRRSLEKAWERYEDITYANESKAGLLDISSEEVGRFAASVQSREDVGTFVQEALEGEHDRRITLVVETVLGGGIALKASDVHIEAEEAGAVIRMRLDGLLTEVAEIDRETYSLLLSRIKLLSGIKLNINETAQDGRFTIEVNDRALEVRASTLPGAFGESIVLRLLDPTAISIELASLGMRAPLQKFMEEELSRPNGMILNTGPTGSGKTTTLYAFLKQIYKPGIKIITIEDPVEYHLDGVTQTQVDREKGYTFLTGLTSSLRQDPDVIMVGEIRDEETAKTAVHAALTGHLVFSTLHTNTAAGTFPRLLDLGANSDILGSAINITMAQRLVRKLCPGSRVKREMNPEEKSVVERVLSTLPDKDLAAQFSGQTFLYDPAASDECPDGYTGRVGIFEVIQVTPEIDSLIKSRASEDDIAIAAQKQGHISMLQDGILKVLEGITSFEELKRVIDIR